MVRATDEVQGEGLAYLRKAPLVEHLTVDQSFGKPLETHLEMHADAIEPVSTMTRHDLDIAVESRRERGWLLFDRSLRSRLKRCIEPGFGRYRTARRKPSVSPNEG